jgi:hypothetical protein
MYTGNTEHGIDVIGCEQFDEITANGSRHMKSMRAIPGVLQEAKGFRDEIFQSGRTNLG